MAFTQSIKEHVIDLKLPEDERWLHVIRKEKRIVGKVIDEILDELPIGGLLLSAAGKIYEKVGGLYYDEMCSWADALEISPSKMAALNLGYEGSMLCSAAILDRGKLGPLHIRCLDWGIASMGPATRIFKFKKGKREFITIGVAGHVGVLSGMMPGKYSVTINWAPTPGNRFTKIDPSGFGATFLLRSAFEDCDTFDDVVYYLKNSDIATSAFFVVCGNSANQGCVIERTKDGSAIRKLNQIPLVQTNHFISRKNQALNELADGELSESSEIRYENFTDALDNLSSNVGIEAAAGTLDIDEVYNGDTIQQMDFCPKSGEYRAWRWS